MESEHRVAHYYYYILHTSSIVCTGQCVSEHAVIEKHTTGCEAQLAGKCQFTSTF